MLKSKTRLTSSHAQIKKHLPSKTAHRLDITANDNRLYNSITEEEEEHDDDEDGEILRLRKVRINSNIRCVRAHLVYGLLSRRGLNPKITKLSYHKIMK